MSRPLSAFSEVVNERRRWNNDWYSWLSELADTADTFTNSFGGFVTVKQFGAKGDASTDDTASIQAAIDFVAIVNGGTVLVPTSTNAYLVSAPIIVPVGVQVVGASIASSALFTRDDTTVMQVNGDYAHIYNLGIYGKGGGADTLTTFGATQAAVVLNGVEARMTHCRVLGGAPSIRVTNADIFIEDVTMGHSFGDCVLRVESGATYVSRCKIDQPWWAGAPAFGAAAFGVWTAATGYLVGDVVSTGGYYIQCTIAGTSGAVAPTLRNYELDIIDNTITWRIIIPTGQDAVRIFANVFIADNTDVSGASIFGVNSLSGSGYTELKGLTFSEQITGAINCDTGFAMYINQCPMQVGRVGGFGIRCGSGFTEDVNISDCTIKGTAGFGIGIDIGCPSVRVRGNYIGPANNGVIIRPNVNNFIIAENSIVNCTRSIDVQAGTSNFYNIVNNLVNSSGAIVDNGTGLNKTLTGNN